MGQKSIRSAVDRTTTASCGLWPFIELARQRGLELERFCSGLGIELSRVRQPFARWSQSTCNRLAQRACDELGEAAAMAAAQTVRAGHFQLLELLIRTAPSVGDGLRLGCRFFPLLHDGGEVVHEKLASGAHAVTWLPPRDYTVHHAFVELTFGVTVGGIRRESRCEHAAADEVSLRREIESQATDRTSAPVHWHLGARAATVAAALACVLRASVMIGYVTLGTNDFERACAFYDQLLSGIGAKRLISTDRSVHWGRRMGPGMLAIYKPYDGQPATAGNGVMVAIGVRSREEVAAMHARALELGAQDDGAPGPRGERFYGAYFRDLDGNKLCVFTYE